MNIRKPDKVTSGRRLDPEEARLRLENRLGPLYARLRLGMEREHEAESDKRSNFQKNLPLTMIETPCA